MSLHVVRLFRAQPVGAPIEEIGFAVEAFTHEEARHRVLEQLRALGAGARSVSHTVRGGFIAMTTGGLDPDAPPVIPPAPEVIREDGWGGGLWGGGDFGGSPP